MGAKKIHNSKQDAWMIWLVMGIGGILIFKFLSLLAYCPDKSITQTLFWVNAFYWSVIFFVAWPARYEIEGETLTVRSGLLLSMKIPVKGINRIGPTRSMMSAPAWSLDRLRLDFVADKKEGMVLVSPEDKELFIRHLLEINPRIELTGGQKDGPEPEPAQ